jgi:hypothetical protein
MGPVMGINDKSISINDKSITALIVPQENLHFTNKVIDLCPPLPGTANYERFRQFECK